jgi:hypothetical protein
MQVNVRHDLKGLEAVLDLYPKELLAAGVRAVNKTLVSVRQAAVNELKPELPGLKVGAIRNQLKIKRATSREFVATLTFTEKRFRLYGNFARTQTRRGIRLRSMPWRIETLDGEQVPVSVLRHAFIQRAVISGVPNVWIRTSLVGKRYPITALLAPSLASAFVERGIGNAVIQVGRIRFPVVLEQEAKFRLSKRS